MSAVSRKRARHSSGTGNGSTMAKVDGSVTATSLKSFVSNLFYLLAIQDDERIFHEAFDKLYSRKVKEEDNGIPLNFKSFFQFLVNFRQSLTNRFLVSQSFVVSSTDGGATGTVAHTSHLTGVEEGKEVKGTIVALLQIGVEDGQRAVQEETFVLETEDV